VAYRGRSKPKFFLDDQRMTSIRVIFSRMTTKKVPALTLVIVGLIGMVAGVLAATITVTQVNFQGEQGIYHNNTGNFVVTDDGLVVVANTQISNDTTALQIPTSGTQGPVAGTALTAGHWSVEFTFNETVLQTGASHSLRITIRAGSGSLGTTLVTYTGTIKEPSASSTGGTILLLDLGASSETSPITAYVSIA
jgi:hypothetical protein